MSEIDDKRLHDWVRQSLHDYQPGFNSQDWQDLRTRLRRRRRWRLTALLLTLCLLGGAGWYVWPSARGPKAETDWPGPRVTKAGTGCTPGPARIGRAVTELVPGKQLAASRLRKRTRFSRKPAGLEAQVSRHQQTPNALARLKPVELILEPDHRLPAVTYVLPSEAEIALMQRVLTEDVGPDSTVLKALSRNLRQWPDAVIVCDLTTSMDPYVAQVYAWFRRNARNPNVLGTLFFTDCDSLGHETRPGGPPGAFFTTHERDPRAALPTMLAAARNTANNRLDPENVVEALRYAQRAFPTAKHLVLLADNGSSAKDMALLAGLRTPVHLIACGVAANDRQAFDSSQYQIAVATGGSVHTIDDDLTQPAQLANRAVIRVGPYYYRYSARRKQFVKTRFSRRPVRFLGIYW